MRESISEIVEEIISLRRDHLNDEARLKVEEALQSHPDNREIRLLGSDIYRIQNNREQSLKLCLHLIDQDSTDWEALGRVAEDLKILDRCEEWVDLGVRVRANLAKDIHTHLNNEVHLRFIGSCLADNPLRVQLWALTLREPISCNSPKSQNRITEETLTSAGKIIPFQYWSQGEPPKAFQEIAAKWNSIFLRVGLQAIRCFDKLTARKWLTDNAPAFLRAFDSAYHYAIEADVFRVAFASLTKAIYLDCDNYPTPHTESILREAIQQGNSLLYFRTHRPALANGFFMSAADCPFFKRLAEKVVDVDFNEKPKDWRFLYEVGPWIYTKTMDELIANNTHVLSPESSPPNIPRLDFDSFSLGFVVEKHACLASPPFPILSNEWSHWQSCLPREGLR
jgi:hypothetical protein